MAQPSDAVDAAGYTFEKLLDTDDEVVALVEMMKQARRDIATHYSIPAHLLRDTAGELTLRKKGKTMTESFIRGSTHLRDALGLVPAADDKFD